MLGFWATIEGIDGVWTGESLRQTQVRGLEDSGFVLFWGDCKRWEIKCKKDNMPTTDR